MRIALSYHRGDPSYDVYESALARCAGALGMPAEIRWLAGAGRRSDLAWLESADGIVLTGGPDVEPGRYGFVDSGGVCRTNPERDGVEWEMLDRLRGRAIPMLAICRGAQIVNVFHGGTLIADLGERNATHRRSGEEWRSHTVSITAGTRLAEICRLTEGTTNSSHHQAVDRLAPGFRASAESADGVLEAYEPADPGAPFLLAVQWHPEAMAAGEPLAEPLLQAFLRAAMPLSS